MFAYIISFLIFFSSLFFAHFYYSQTSINQHKMRVDCNFILFFGIVGCVFIGGFRWQTGTDWSSYYGFFTENVTWKDFNSDPSFELGWKLLNFFVKKITSSYSFFLIVFHLLLATITYVSIFELKRITELDYFLFYYLFFAARKGDFFATRQILAMSLMLLATVFYLKNEKKKFWILGLVATLIHVSVVFIFFIPIIFRLNLTRGKLISICLFTFIFSLFSREIFFFLMQKILMVLQAGRIYGKIVTYMNVYQGQYSVGIISIIRYFLFVPFLFHVYKKSDNVYKRLFNCYFFGCCMYIITGSIMPILLRIAQNFINFEAVVISMYIVRLKKGWYRIFFLAFLIIYGALKYFMTFYGEYSDLYIPYYSILSQGIRGIDNLH